MKNNRRTFIKKAALGAAGIGLGTNVNAMSAKSYDRIIGANDRINLALQGLGRRYSGYIPPIADKSSNVQLLYLCDVMQKQMDGASAKFSKHLDYQPKQEVDIRKILEDKEVDAIFMATPDHWHTPGACMAMQAGKHVYLEKPCSHNGRENELVVACQEKYDKKVQMGNQQRSSAETEEVIKAIHDGQIGKAYKAIAFYVNRRGRVQVPEKAAPPAGLNWELFQGPAPRKAYMHDTWNYNWHWYGWDYGTAEMGNNATHELDIARWALDVEYPEHVSVIAGKHHYKDDGWEMYDTMEATFDYGDNRIIQWDGQSRNGYNRYNGKGRGTIILGSEGSVFVDREGYAMYNLAGELIKESQSANKESGLALGGGGDLTTRHSVNFFDAIRGKAELTSPIQQGALSQSLTHYANIAARIDKSFDIDQQTGRIYDRDAMQLWSRSYEPGWEIKL